MQFSDPFITLALYSVITYITILIVSIFVILPYLIAKGYIKEASDSFGDPIREAIYFCLFWPITYIGTSINYLLKFCILYPVRWLIISPSKYIFNQAIKFYASKLAKYPITSQLEINEAQTGYRNVKFKR